MQDNNRLYFDEIKGFVPFPEKWYKHGKFIDILQEIPTCSFDNESGPNQDELTITDDERAGGLWVPGKGMVTTYIFEERTKVCKYFDTDCGAWLILPLQWEMNLDFIKKRVEQVQERLPSLSDHREVTAALRQCNYDADEVISIFLAIFGDILLIPFKSQRDYKDENGYRHLIERDIIIDNLRQKLEQSNTTVENLHEKIRELLEDNCQQSEMIQHLNRKISELEVNHKEALDRIAALQKICGTYNSVSITPGSYMEPKRLLELHKCTRELSISNRHLRSMLNHKISEISQTLNKIMDPVLKLKNTEAALTQETEDLRSLYKKEALEKKLLYNKLQEICGNVKVFCRCRQDSEAQTILDFPSENEITVNQNGNVKRFSFHKVYPPYTTQDQVFEGTQPIITSCADGYNICIVAYGQTGSGKTYTMMGNEGDPGVNIRSIGELLRICQQRKSIRYTIKVSMLEIYNEAVQDLLSNQPRAQLEVMTQGRTVAIPGLTEIEVKTESDIKNVMQLGSKNRTVASTKMNSESSRSHLILMLWVNGVDSYSGAKYHGTLTLCDLAGSEQISQTEAAGQRLVEAAAINKSLAALGQVLVALKNNALHIPFKNSKLTRLLQPAFSRDAKVCIFINVNSNIENLGETLRTLQFGSSVQQVSLGKIIQNCQAQQLK
ncbi:kinesin-like protein klp-3 [Hemitrygon akajei]|uniref:kinesin-like protein klp-3 n=1 Tax=Hemitrygon akajei TaxID=2704970 RepID=UPI003BF98ABE